MRRRTVMCAAFVLYTGSLVLAQEPARSDGWVVIPVDDYRSLRLKAYPPERPPEAPPIDAALTRIEYDLRVNGESASGEARLTVDVLKEGWVHVDIPAGMLVPRGPARRPRAAAHRQTLASRPVVQDRSLGVVARRGGAPQDFRRLGSGDPAPLRRSCDQAGTHRSTRRHRCDDEWRRARGAAGHAGCAVAGVRTSGTAAFGHLEKASGRYSRDAASALARQRDADCRPR